MLGGLAVLIDSIYGVARLAQTYLFMDNPRITPLPLRILGIESDSQLYTKSKSVAKFLTYNPFAKSLDMETVEDVPMRTLPNTPGRSTTNISSSNPVVRTTRAATDIGTATRNSASVTENTTSPRLSLPTLPRQENMAMPLKEYLEKPGVLEAILRSSQGAIPNELRPTTSNFIARSSSNTAHESLFLNN